MKSFLIGLQLPTKAMRLPKFHDFREDLLLGSERRFFRTAERLAQPINMRASVAKIVGVMRPTIYRLSRQGGYTHIPKGYFYSNLVGTLSRRTPGIDAIAISRGPALEGYATDFARVSPCYVGLAGAP
jgi:hypothetical protein